MSTSGNRTQCRLKSRIIKSGECKVRWYLRNAKDPKEIGVELTERCEERYFLNRNIKVPKFKVGRALSYTSSLENNFLISQQREPAIFYSFLHWKGVIRTGVLSP
jgi:hypothetical protein